MVWAQTQMAASSMATHLVICPADPYATQAACPTQAYSNENYYRYSCGSAHLNHILCLQSIVSSSVQLWTVQVEQTWEGVFIMQHCDSCRFQIPEQE